MMGSASSPPFSEGSARDTLSVIPFRALRYAGSGAQLAAVLSPPYDVVDEPERERLERSDPHNVVRLILPRGPAEGPSSRYELAAQTFRDWQSDGVLRRDAGPAMYVYELSSADGAVTRGLLATVGLHPSEDGVILPHENTMAGPVADRLRLTEATGADLEPIYLAYEGAGDYTADLIERIASAPPAPPVGHGMVQCTTDDGVSHRLWPVSDPEVLRRVAADLAPARAVIADGHHRYATYLRYQREQRERYEASKQVTAEQTHATGGDRLRAPTPRRDEPRDPGPAPWDSGLALLVDICRSGLRVEAIHRVIATLPLDVAIDRAAAGFTLTPIREPVGAGTGVPPAGRAIAELGRAGRDGPAFAIGNSTGWFLLTAPRPELLAALPAGHSAAWRSLDVTVAHRLLIDRLWAVEDREDVVGFEHDVATAVRRAAAGTVLLLNPTLIGQVADVARAGDRMPRKSTLFTPKPRTGLVIRPID